jgi:hypothetical protein
MLAETRIMPRILFYTYRWHFLKASSLSGQLNAESTMRAGTSGHDKLCFDARFPAHTNDATNQALLVVMSRKGARYRELMPLCEY